MAIATTVKPKFYELFSTAQVREIFQFLQHDRIIPFKFFYQGDLIKSWQALNEEQAKAPISSAKVDDNFLRRICIKLLQSEATCDRWNIVDIGAANPQLVKRFVGSFLENNRLNAYLALDISPDILEMSQQDLTTWFPALNWQGIQWDFEQTPLPNAVAVQRQNETQTVENMYLYTGDTFCNVIDRLAVLQNVAAGMQPQEYLYITFGVEFKVSTRQDMDIKTHISKSASLELLDWLDINLNDADILGYFDEEWGGYKTDILIKADYDITFRIQDKTEIISLKQGEQINIYRFFAYTIEPDNSAPQIFADFQQAGLEILSYRIEPILSRVMLVCRLLPASQ
ncbi:MAG: L-histidine N(alpha)-methyltransferase [Spirulina sp. SIO3F2]|nr:L-histidine N(alpha)-methyltransferase [Spirulina sp. SIO3F2]